MYLLIFLLFVLLGNSEGSAIKFQAFNSSSQVILVSGGFSRSVGAFFVETGETCTLPSLPDARYHHTMSGLTVCGGHATHLTETTCLTFSSGGWGIRNTLVDMRTSHCSWETDEGLLLMGGYISPNTSEIATTSSTQAEPSFTMHAMTAESCSIADLTSESGIITGGYHGHPYYLSNKVTRYDKLGFLENLPSLLIGRTMHGCGAYLREEDGTQVLLVAGGAATTHDIIDSTEILISGQSVWSLTNPLPKKLTGIRTAVTSVEGKLYLTGGYDDDAEEESNEVITWVEEKQKWARIGEMKNGMSYHAAATIPVDNEAMKYCI